MDKNAIKKYAVWARRELIARVSQKAMQYGISPEETVPATSTSVNGVVLSAEEQKQRKALIEQIRAKSYEQVMEEVAYTWFNRFSALRFMEVNGYLPSRVRVFTDEENNFKPQILVEAINLEIAGLDMEKVYALKDANDTEALFKYLIITQCNALNSVLPGMFQRISDYTELLFPDNLLRDGSAVQQMIELIPEEDWKDAVQIIGWLYQYYNSEKKDEVFAALKKNVKITKENIPAATQLFTPDWIVRYMVENSLGRLWVEGHPNEELKSQWKYYLEEAEQVPDVQAQLASIREEYKALKPEDILCIDPCSGSGHICAYLFDVLMQIYDGYGYTTREAVRSIVENNLYGLDIDDRAAQLAYFAVMMKARQYDKRFLTRKDEDGKPDVPQPHVYAIVESNGLNNLWKSVSRELASLFDVMYDAKEYGSILNVPKMDFDALRKAVEENTKLESPHYLELWNEKARVLTLIDVAEALTQKYHVVTTNPPYFGGTDCNDILQEHIKKCYADSKADLFAVFIERCADFVKKGGYQAMITMHSWMFLSSYEKLRAKLRAIDTVNMVHLGARAFEEISGEIVQTTSFIIRNTNLSEYKGVYCRLVSPTTQNGKEELYLTKQNRYVCKQSDFTEIGGSPVAYWASPKARAAYSHENMNAVAQPRHGLATSDNDRFLKLWHEVDIEKTSTECRCDYTKKWYPMSKGGSFRKWYGNLEWLINYENDGEELKKYAISIYKCSTRTIQNTQFYFKKGLTWSALASGGFSVRWQEKGALFGSGGYCAFASKDILSYILALLNSKATAAFIQFVSPTLNYEVGHIKTIPVVIDEEKHTVVDEMVSKNIAISRGDWDSFETSWDFSRHPLVPLAFERQEQEASQFHATRMEKFGSLAWHYQNWEQECVERFAQLKANEEELNRIFIDIYGLQDELTPEVEDKDVTVRLADKKRDVKSLISYAVGCMFGRYSLDTSGLAYAGGEWDASKYGVFPADKDNIIPICDDEYFEDDIVGRFEKFIETVYGKETLTENLRFIADALGGSGQPKEVIRNYFLNDFYADHLKIYQKRPIYWLFDSGKKNGFKALVYMHRYAPDTIARMRTDYVHEQQSRYRTAIADLDQRIASASTSERVKLNKKLKTLQEQATEIQGYEEKIHHMADQYIAIDLDDGVKVNYAKFQDVLAKIK